MIVGDVGLSKYTSGKMQSFSAIFAMQTSIMERISTKFSHKLSYTYYDLTAGPGVLCNRCGQCEKRDLPCAYGSPVIAEKILQHRDGFMRKEMICLEQNPELQPEWYWVEKILADVRKSRKAIFFKPNLSVRPIEIPRKS